MVNYNLIESLTILNQLMLVWRITWDKNHLRSKSFANISCSFLFVIKINTKLNERYNDVVKNISHFLLYNIVICNVAVWIKIPYEVLNSLVTLRDAMWLIHFNSSPFPAHVDEQNMLHVYRSLVIQVSYHLDYK